MRKIGSDLRTVKIRPQFEEAAGTSFLVFDCLFPMEKGATGINSSTPTASLTGRIWFFVAVTNHYSPIVMPTC